MVNETRENLYEEDPFPRVAMGEEKEEEDGEDLDSLGLTPPDDASDSTTPGDR